MGTLRLPNGQESREFGIGDLRRLDVNELRELAEPVIVVHKQSGSRLAVLVPYEQYIDAQTALGLVLDVAEARQK